MELRRPNRVTKWLHRRRRLDVMQILYSAAFKTFEAETELTVEVADATGICSLLISRPGALQAACHKGITEKSVFQSAALSFYASLFSSN